ncbi:MAG: SLBB domain-containing protein [Candidatus Alcyoniella australis]|nr:SLBB domain-containing protein [Candidatus Alcyoniella australis]
MAVTGKYRPQITAIILVVLLTLCSCAKNVGPDSQTAEQPLISVERPGASALPPTQAGPYTLGLDDLLLITVYGREELLKEGPIDPDGAIFVPLVGRVPAAGLTVVELQIELTALLAHFLRDPQVDVQIIEYRSRKFFVLGEVLQPGVFAGRGETTLIEAVGLAGGLTQDANLSEAFLVREDSVVPVDFRALFRGGETGRNLPVQRGDLIYVPSASTLRVYVLGEVNLPTVVVMRHGRLTLAEAIAEAGGFNENYAYKSGVQVVRGGLAEPTVYTVNFRDVLRGRQLDRFDLEPGDIVFVPATGLTKWERAMQQLLPNLSRIIVDAAAAQSLVQ